MIFSSQEFADFTEISKKSVQNYRKQGMPFIKKNKYYYYDFKAIQWLFDNGIKAITGINTEQEEQTPKYRKDLAEAKIREFTLKKLEGKYILKKEVEEEYFKIGRLTRDTFQSLSKRIAHKLLKKEKIRDIENIIDKEVNKNLSSLSS